MRRPTPHRLALGVLTVVSPLCLGIFLWETPYSEVIFALAVILFPCALMLLGASRQNRAGVAAWTIALLCGVLLAVMAGLFAFRNGGVDGPSWGGLPMAAAIQLYGLFLLPLCISSLGYAMAFDASALDDEALRTLRRRFSKSREADCDLSDTPEDAGP